MYKFLGLNPKR